jgi:hypothetical protein
MTEIVRSQVNLQFSLVSFWCCSLPLYQEQTHRLPPPRTLILDFTLTHRCFGRSNLHPIGQIGCKFDTFWTIKCTPYWTWSYLTNYQTLLIGYFTMCLNYQFGLFIDIMITETMI